MPTQSPLIAAEELRQLLEQGSPSLLDVRYALGSDAPTGVQTYAAGHLPGAVYLDLDTALAAPPDLADGGGRHPLPEAEVFVAAIRRAGVDRDRPVVLYDDWQAHAAARGWWLLEYYGHPDVRVLDGGLAAWREIGGALETGTHTPAPGDFSGEPGRLPVTEAAQVSEADVLIDARAPQRYAGEVEPIDPVAGHIPGAVNVPTADNLGPDRRFRPAAELAARYAEVGAVPGASVTAYCGSGVTACHDVLAMRLAGVEAALQPGSWSGWITDPNRPVARGTVPS